MFNWHDGHNAELYNQFARQHKLYRHTSRQLTNLVRLRDAKHIVDLACGTGITTEEILQHVDKTVRVSAIDSSTAMLFIARQFISDKRVSWIQGDAAEIDRHTKFVDTIICNSAIWQLDIDKTLSAAANILQPGGEIAFNIGKHFLRLPSRESQPQKTTASLRTLVQSIAMSEHGFTPSTGKAKSQPRLSVNEVIKTLLENGFEPHETHFFTYTMTPDEELAWLKVPIFAQAVLPGMPHKQQLEIMNKAFEHVDKEYQRTSDWMIFIATRL